MTKEAHIKVAVTSNNLTEVDADFISARQILLYDVSPSHVSFLDAMQFDGRPPGQRGPGGGMGCANSDPLDGASIEMTESKLAALAGCGLLLTRQLSDFAAVRIQKGNTFPVKLESKHDIAKTLLRIQSMLKADTPRWLQRRMIQEEEAPSGV